MEALSFLDGPQISEFKVVSWNVNGVSMKLESSMVQKFLLQYDIIGLNEVKNSYRVPFPGYVTYSGSMVGGGCRGGTVVLVKRHLQSHVVSVDTSVTDQVWIHLVCVPGVLFGFCYLPPAEAPLFDPSQFSDIQEKVKSKVKNTKVVIHEHQVRNVSSGHTCAYGAS